MKNAVTNVKHKKVVKLKELFKMQKALDEYISKEKAENYSDEHVRKMNKIFSLKTEIHEAWNDSMAFKMWSERYKQPKDTLLKELVDVLHFILSIALEFKLEKELETVVITNKGFANINKMFFYLDHFSSRIFLKIPYGDIKGIKISLLSVIDCYFKIVDYYGWTFEDVYKEYVKKNEENFKRQAVGY